ncbi:unnamed protein product [Periconia digitata]|uniref:Metallo-beta-lactamase domain-containing protein n=1 Tax=Periconia digitata TaxID=1303443 RepID=A0A9W4U0A7_9PLEO|nr:unnamed protein product [Periconia digitata]
MREMFPSNNAKQTEAHLLPSSQNHVTLHALSAGHFTLPEYQFVQPVSREARKHVPSLAFLIQHHNSNTGKITRIVFDLGLRGDIKRYPSPIQKHIETRQPMITDPDVVKSLAKGGLAPEHIDYVVYSYIHWDHIGEPRDFSSSIFIVGSGAASLCKGTSAALRGGHSFFEQDLLPADRIIELAAPDHPPAPRSEAELDFEDANFNQPWKLHRQLPHVLDIFNDGSTFIVDAPGHLPGHINLLVRLESHWVYLGGDSCHDRRLLTGEKSIGEWEDAEGQICCIHADRESAEETIVRIRQLEKDGVEVIFAHDVEWEKKPANRSRFLGNS